MTRRAYGRAFFGTADVVGEQERRRQAGVLARRALTCAPKGSTVRRVVLNGRCQPVLRMPSGHVWEPATATVYE